MEKLIILAALLGCSFAGIAEQAAAYGHVAHEAYAEHGHGHVHNAHAAVYAKPAAYHHGHHHELRSGAPHGYRKEVPAAAIRNVEQVDVRKTITPVVTKQTTHHTHSEPALAVGHVHGYTQHFQGPPAYAPVHYNTKYTTYSNPTVGVNGPVTYAGPAVSEGVAVGVHQVAAAPVAYGGGEHAYHGHGHGGEALVEAPPVAFGGHHYAAPVAAVPVADYGHYGHAAAEGAGHEGHGHGHGYVGVEGLDAGYGAGQVIAHTDYNTYAHSLGFKK